MVNKRKLFGMSAVGLIVFAAIWYATQGQPPLAKVHLTMLGYTNSAHKSIVLRDGNINLSFSSAILTHDSNHGRVAVLQISNASPFDIIRSRSPHILFDSPSNHSEPIPTGWKMLRPTECEQIWIGNYTNNAKWRLSLACQPLLDDSNGVGPRGLKSKLRNLGIWLRDHGVPIAIQQPKTEVSYSSDWIDP